VDILGLYTDISKLLLGTVSHRCSESIYVYLMSIALLVVAHYTHRNTYSPTFP